MHNIIKINDLSISFPHKICFESFSTDIHYGNRIGIIGHNGSGKTTLLQTLQQVFSLKNISVGVVSQTIDGYDLSGGERFQKNLTDSLISDPDILCLDEPTNHLDLKNRKNFMRRLKIFPGTILVISHDVDFLQNYAEILWHIHDGKIKIFYGNYRDYMHEFEKTREKITENLQLLNQKKKETHDALMKEQVRASKSSAKGEKSIRERKWPTVVSGAKAKRAEETSGRKKAAIDEKKQELLDQLSTLRLNEKIVPKFFFKSPVVKDRVLFSISDGEIGYAHQEILKNIQFSISSQERIHILGPNGSGKSTLIKAILNDDNIIKKGEWGFLKVEDIGYLDQHYKNLPCKKTVFEVISDIVPSWSHIEIRKHLNDFLFRRNEEVNMMVENLSEGEKARLSLAQIAASAPKLLILDEITNNLDIETKEHVIEVLNEYSGAMIIISHDMNFIGRIKIDKELDVSKISVV